VFDVHICEILHHKLIKVTNIVIFLQDTKDHFETTQTYLRNFKMFKDLQKDLQIVMRVVLEEGWTVVAEEA